jgi:hypothetical protein
MSYKTKIQGVKFPEDMFVFAVPKGDNYKYFSNIDGNVFAKLNIKEVQFTFGGHSLSYKTKIQGKKFPEDMFVFAVPKGDNYKYFSNIDGNVFA